MISLQNFSATAIRHNQKDTSRVKLLHVTIATMVLQLALAHLVYWEYFKHLLKLKVKIPVRENNLNGRAYTSKNQNLEYTS